MLLNKTTFRIISCMFIDKHLTYLLKPSSGSFSTFTAAERHWKRLLKLCTQGKYKDYCKHQNEISTKIHDAKKAREYNLLLSEQESEEKEARECEQSNSQMSSPEKGKSK